MHTPRAPLSPTGRADRGASRVSGAVAAGRRGWARVQRLRPWRAFSRFTDAGGGVLAAGMSYQAVFAVFAALWVGFGIFGISLRGRPELLDTLVAQINLLVPGLLGDGDDGVVSTSTLLAARNLDWTSIVAGASLLWVTLAWFTGTRRAIRIIFGLDVKQYRNAVLLKLRDLVLALLFLALLVVSAALTLFSSDLTETVLGWWGADPDNWLLGWLGVTVRYGAVYVFDVIVLYAIHRFLAEVRLPFRRLLTGCALGAAALFVLKVLGTALLGGATSNPLLATFAVLIGLLIWFNLVCRALLLTAAWIAAGQDPDLGVPEAAGEPREG